MDKTLKQAILDGTATGLPVRELGLKGRTLVHLDGDTCAVLIDRKSRFLRKDAQQFVNVLSAARTHAKRALKGVVLIRQAPVCSQAKAWLEEQQIQVDLVAD